jgi:hypothetical protein
MNKMETPLYGKPLKKLPINGDILLTILLRYLLLVYRLPYIEGVGPAYVLIASKREDMFTLSNRRSDADTADSTDGSIITTPVSYIDDRITSFHSDKIEISSLEDYSYIIYI